MTPDLLHCQYKKKQHFIIVLDEFVFSKFCMKKHSKSTDALLIPFLLSSTLSRECSLPSMLRLTRISCWPLLWRLNLNIRRSGVSVGVKGSGERCIFAVCWSKKRTIVLAICKCTGLPPNMTFLCKLSFFYLQTYKCYLLIYMLCIYLLCIKKEGRI